MNNRNLELLVGVFVAVGLGAIFYLAIQVGGARFFGDDSYEVNARFGNANGINAGGRVEIAGVPVGTISKVVLDENFFAIVTLRLPKSLELDDGTIASIKTAGLIGDRYISLRPGGFGESLVDGDLIVDTESALDIESLISRFAFGGIDEKEE